MEPENLAHYANKWVGREFSEAYLAAELEGFELCEMEIDGEPQAGILNYVPNRVNIATENELITRIISVG